MIETTPAEYKGYRVHDEIEVNVKFPIDRNAKNPHDLCKVMTNNFVYQLKAVKDIINQCARNNDNLIGTVIQIVNPIEPQHSSGMGILTGKSGIGKLKFEVWQNGSKQWYKLDDIKGLDKETGRQLLKLEDPNVEAWNEYEKQNKKLCDQYKESINEAMEDLKESACSSIHSTDAIDYHLAELFKKQSTSTTADQKIWTGTNPTMTGGTTLIGKPYKTCAEMYGNTFLTQEEKQLTKRGLALLAEQKQIELKEIEELIKKL